MTTPFLRSVFGELYCDSEIADVFDAPVFTRHMLAFEAAWTAALRDVGVVPADDARVALAAINRNDTFDLKEGSARDGVPVPALVKALREGLAEGQARAIHTGATSQDVVDSAMALSLLQAHRVLLERLEEIASALTALSAAFGSRTMMARTRMQAAMPADARLRIDAWHRAVQSQIDRAELTRTQIAQLQVGGAIGRRDTPDRHASQVAANVASTLGLNLGPVWHCDRSGPVAFGHWLTLVSGTMGKIGQDIALMAQQGVDDIALGGGGGSSAMPHKQNPVAAEAMVGLARYVAGQQGILAQAMIHEQERSGSAWALEWMTLPAMAEATGAALNAALRVLRDIKSIGAAD